MAAKASDAVWSLDATHLGRDANGKVDGMLVKDVATMRVLGSSVGEPACATDVLALLDEAERVRGILPHVLAMDNGPANRNALVCTELARRQVVALWNVPHTPEHNAWVESPHGELKAELRATGALRGPGADPTQRPRSLSATEWR